MALSPLMQETALTACCLRGEELLAAATMIGDQADFHVWRQKRNDWVAVTAAAIASSTNGEAARTFLDAAHMPRPLAGWQQAIPAEADGIREALSVVEKLADRPEG
jgi:predicted alpha/beta hydrolase